MQELDRDEDARKLEAIKAQLGVLEADTSFGKTLTYEASDAVDVVTRKILERSWRQFGEAGDPHKELVVNLLERAHTLRRKVSRFGGPRYDAEYRAWIGSWHDAT